MRARASVGSFLFLFALVGTAVAAAGGCGSDSGNGNTFPGGDDVSVDDASGGDATPIFGDSGTAQGPIEIRPADPVLTSTGQPLTQQFQAFFKGTQTAVPASWSIDKGTLGIINVGSGLFTATGAVGGVATVTATAGAKTATTTVTVKVRLADNPGNVSAGDQGKLRGGGPASNDPGFKWLYPYDATVFPRGLRAPTLQLGGNAPDAVYVHVESKLVSYDAFFGASNPARITLDEARWKTITDSAGGKDTVTVSVTKISGGVVTGPIKETWTIAEGSLKGSVYYNTYSTPQGQSGAGALLKVRPGTTVDAQVFVGNCTVCHSVSANGSTIASGFSWSNGNPTNSGIVSIDAMGAPKTTYSEALGRYAFGALTPDGTLMVSNANGPGGIRGLSGSDPSALYATANGAKVAANGFDGVVKNAQMPSFSPDGKLLVFNNRDTNNVSTLAVMSFDEPSKTFSQLANVWTDPSGKHVAWPAFLPDGKAVVFHAGGDFGTQNHAFDTDVEIVDLTTKTRFKLPALNGFTGTDTAFAQSYLPYGEAAEAHLNYEPTVLPVAVGGYYWVVFTSRRCYGNFFGPSQDPWALDQNQSELSPRKKLWVAAIDINPTPGQDRSHPAFYLPGQELLTGNMRAYWTLDACKQNGDTCESGDECCGGFCRAVTDDAGTHLSCTAQPQGCAHEFEKCSTSGDCCEAAQGYQCLNGHCARPAPK